MSVDSADTPKIEVLDGQGGVIYVLPPDGDRTLDRVAELERQVLELRQEVKELRGLVRT